MVKLSIIILNYKTKELTLACIDSIVKNYKEELDRGDLEIILVDNASEDDSINAFKKSKHFKYLNLVLSRENLGFGKGNNLGGEKSKGEFLLFLNSDTEIKDDGFSKMVEFIKENKSVGILGGKLYFPDGRVQSSVGKFYTLFNLFLMLFGGERAGFLRESPAKITKVDWVSGACMMIKRDIFEKVGGFDKNIFMYMEDVDICYVARKIGYSTYFYPNILLLHNERGSSNKTFAILNIYKGVKYFYKKHMPGWRYDVALFLLKAKATVVKSIGTILGNSYYVQTYGQALEILK